MDRRHMLGTLSSAVALAAGARTIAVAAEDKPAGHHHDAHAKSLADCLAACTSCMNECNMTAHYCFEEAGRGEKKFLMPLHMAVDCQEFCAQSAKMIGRVSPLMGVSCHACADACEKCAAECEKVPADEQLARCAKECRACAKSCQEMMEHAGHHAASDARTTR